MKDKTRHRLKKIPLYLGIAVSSVILLLGLFFLLVYFGAFGPLPGKAELAAISNEEASLVYSSNLSRVLSR